MRRRTFLATLTSAAAPICAQEPTPTAVAKPTLHLAREGHWLVVNGGHLPKGEIRINYLEAYCRAGSTAADWVTHTTVGHTTELISAPPDGKSLNLRCQVKDGLVVDHEIRAGDDEITFTLKVHNPTNHLNEAHWAQPCIRLGDFAGGETADPKEVNIKLDRSFIFLNGCLTRLPTNPWATQALHTPGQVWCPKDVPRTDVNPRPLSTLVPSHGLIGCFSQDDQWIFAVAFSPYQELFQGVARCLHSDFRIGEVKPGETKSILGKIYIVPNARDEGAALLQRYQKDFGSGGGGND